jgi:zinc protease
MSVDLPGDGLRILVRRVPGMPVVACRALLRSGSRLEKIPGQSVVTGRLLSEGSEQRDWETINRQAEDLGMLIQTFGTYETLGVSIDALAEDWRRALDWLRELLLQPSFPLDRFDWIRRQTAADLESLLDEPEVKTSRAFRHQLYSPHPYGRSLQGSAESLAELCRQDVVDFHRRSLEMGMLVVVAGEIDEEETVAHASDLFAQHAPTRAMGVSVPPARGLEIERQEIVAGEGDQAHLYLGHLTVPRRHRDIPALDLVGVVLGAGAGLSGRLPDRIREKEGLAYSTEVATSAGAGLEAGRFSIYLGTSPENLEQAERSLRQELDRLLTDGIGEQELRDARSYLVGRDPFRRETARQWASLMAEAGFYGIPADRPEWAIQELEKLSHQEVEEAMRRWIRPADLRLTVGLPRRK